MSRLAAVPAIVLASVLTCLAGCSDIPGPGGTTQNSLSLILSAPVRGPVGATRVAGPAASAVSTSVVYVSLPPGSVPAGVRATITNQTTGLSVTTALVDGGFDPVPLAASVGDTLVTDIAGAALATLAQVRLAVSSVRPLKVVRTSPSSGGRDVPLNATIVIVFGEPIDPATLTAGSVQLWRDATPVAGTVRFADALQLRVEFHPDRLLAAQTAYRLVVTQAIRDVNGVVLESPVDVLFTTGGTLRLAFTASPSNARVGWAISPAVRVALLDASGDTVKSFSDTIRVALSDNPPGATLSGTTTAVAVAGVARFADLRIDRPGTGYTLIATARGLSTGASATFSILPVPLNGRVAFVSDRDGTPHIYLANPDGSGITQLTSGSAADAGPTWSPDGTKIAFQRGSEMYVIQADGTGLAKLPAFGGDPAWCPFAGRIVFSDGVQLYTRNADGSGIALVTGLTAPPGALGVGRQTWSPDCQQIAFELDQIGDVGLTQVYVVNADGSALRRLTFPPPFNINFAEGGPAWSPDGTTIAFWSYGFSVATVPSDGPGVPSTVYLPNLPICGTSPGGPFYCGLDFYAHPAWSPDGRMIVFNYTVPVSGARQIWLVRFDRSLLGAPFISSLNAWDAAWGPQP